MTPLATLERSLELIRRVRLEHIARVLDTDHSGAAGRLATLEAAAAALRPRQGSGFTQVALPVQESLARRALLGRRTSILSELSTCWTANGTPTDVAADAVKAVEAARAAWGTPVVDLSAEDVRGVPATPGYAAFVAALGEIERRDPSGPLGRAVRGSRYGGSPRRSWACPSLPGESRAPAGFPAVLRHGADAPSALSASAWIEPVPSWPAWLTDRSNPANGAVAAALERCREARARWAELEQRVEKLVRAAGYDAASNGTALPDWLLLFVAEHGLEDVESAGLALSVRAVTTERRPLPAGVGFSGTWGADRRLGPVTHIREKLSAAREAGIFVLFVCADRAEVPTSPADGDPLLALLPPGAPLDEVVRLVNTACSSLGLTADRSAYVSGKLGEQSQSVRPGRTASRVLPDASNLLPVEFVGRQRELGTLNRWKTDAAGNARRFAVLCGGMRAGKTTLLAHWLRDRSAWPLYPTWFSCVRGHSQASRYEHVRDALEAQLLARFCLLPLPPDARSANESNDELWSPEVRAALAATTAVIDVVVDGVDEVRAQDHEEVVELLKAVPGGGLRLVAGQTGTPALDRVYEAERIELNADRAAARELIEQFARAMSATPALRAFGGQLGRDPGRLAERAGDNLWVLTEALDAVLKELIPAPATVDDFPVRPSVEGYVLELVREVCEAVGPAGPTAERLIRTLALLGGDEAWAASDVCRVDGSLRADEVLRVADGPVRRFLVTQSGGMRFRDDTFRRVIADAALDRDRECASGLTGALVNALTDPSDPTPAFLARFATKHAAAFVLRYTASDSSLAARLLRTPWASRRFVRLAADKATLTTLYEELSDLIAQAEATESVAPYRAALETLLLYRSAIESGTVPVESWWRHLAPVREGQLGPIHPTATAGVGPTLLAPALGYASGAAQAVEFGGAGCAVGAGTAERLLLAGPDGRIFVFARSRLGWDLVRVIPSGGGEVLDLEALADGLVVGLRRLAPPEDDGAQSEDRNEVRRLELIDPNSDSQPMPLDAPCGLLNFTAIDSVEGRARLAVVTECSDARVMCLYRLAYTGRGSQLRRNLSFVSEGAGIFLPSRVWRLRAFAPGTWAVCSTADGPAAGAALTVYRATGEEIVPLSGPELARTCDGYWINGVCRLPGDRLAAVLSPRQRRPAGQGVHLLVVAADGTLDLRIRLDTPGDPDADESLDLVRPLGWHDHYKVLLGHSGCAYYTLDLAPESRPGRVADALADRICVTSEDSVRLRDAVPLTGGRVALVYNDFAWVVGPDSGSVRRVCGTAAAGTLRLLGATRQGALTVCDESPEFDNQYDRSGHRYLTPGQPATAGTLAEDGFLNVGPTGLVASRRGRRLFVSDGTAEPRELWNADDLRDALDGLELEDRLDDALCRDDDNWVCALFARESAPPGPNGGWGGVRARRYLVLVGCLDGRVDHITFTFTDDEDEDARCRIECMVCGVVAFRCGRIHSGREHIVGDWGYHPLCLYDLVAGDIVRVDHAEMAYRPPLVGLSSEWVLLVAGEPADVGRGDGVYRAYQYRVGSPDPPEFIAGLELTSRLSVPDRSDGRADVREWRLDQGRTSVRAWRFAVGSNFGLRVPPTPTAADLGRGVAAEVSLGPTLVAVARDSHPHRVEVLRLAAAESPLVAVGYLAEPPYQVECVRGPGGAFLAVATASGVTWFDLGELPDG